MRRALASLSLVAALCATPLLARAEPGDPAPGPQVGPGAGGATLDGARARGRMDRRGAHRARKLLRALDLDATQRQALKAARDAAEPVRTDLHSQVRALRESARAGERTAETRKALHEKVQAARQSAMKAVEPAATTWVSSLKPEQKEKLAERAKAHGKTFDEAKLVRGVEKLLLMPRGARGRR